MGTVDVGMSRWWRAVLAVVIALPMITLIPAQVSAAGPQGQALVAATPPTAPRNVTATDNHDRTVTIAWAAPSSTGGSAITSYRIRQWAPGANPATATPLSTSSCSSSCRQQLWTGFFEETRSFFGVSAVNALGEGTATYTGVLTVHLYPGAPSGLTAYAGNNQTMINWSAAPTNGGPAIDSYVVAAFHPTNSALHKIEEVCGACRSHVINGLVNGIQYTVVVRAHNPNGYSDPWASGTVTPVANAAPYPPQFPWASPGSGEAMVTWQAPPANGGPAVDGYVIQAWRGTTFASQRVVISSAFQNRYIYTGLVNGQSYTFRIYAYSDEAGVSAFAPTTAVTPVSSPPPYPPRSPVAVAGAAAIVVTWQAPESGPAPSSYTVVGFSTTGGYFVQQETLTGLDRATIFTGLDPDTQYFFAIVSNDPNGSSGAVVTANTRPIGGNLLTPTNVQAARGDTRADVTWTAPTLAIDGTTSYTVTAYRAADDSVVSTATTTATSVAVSELRNGTPVYFRVVATNLILDGPASVPSNTITPAGLPFAPENVSAIRGDRQVTVTWDPPTVRSDGTSGDNGDPISSYEIAVLRAIDDMVVSTATATGGSVIVDGLTNGTGYYAVVRATNSVGAGDQSTPSLVVTPAGPPFAPINVSAIAGNEQALVTWNHPPMQADGTPGDNGDAITTYSVVASPGGQTRTVDAGSTQAEVFDLTNGAPVTFTVTATNGVGAGVASAPSSPVTPIGAPATPQNVVATVGEESATVTWDASDPNGSTYVTYTVMPFPDGDGQETPSTSAQFSDLVAGTEYTFTVVATNAAGSSPASAPSEPVIPNYPEIGEYVALIAAASDTEVEAFYSQFDGDGDGVAPGEYTDEELTALLLHGGVNVWLLDRNIIPAVETFQDPCTDSVGFFPCPLVDRHGYQYGEIFGDWWDIEVVPALILTAVALEFWVATGYAAQAALDDDPGEIVAVVESMSSRSRLYQQQVTGLPQTTAYRVNNVNFDGYRQGILLDAKGLGYSWAVQGGRFINSYRGADGLLAQAQRQLVAASGRPIRWEVAEETTATAIRNLLLDNGITGIDIRFVAPIG